MMEELLILIVGMALVTYLPRMLPLLLLKEIKLPPFIRRVFEFIPYAVLSALIFPGILSSTGNLNSALLGGVIALYLALVKVNLTLIVLGGIGGAFIWQIIF